MDLANINGLTRTFISGISWKGRSMGLGFGNSFRQMTSMKGITIKTGAMVKDSTGGEMEILTMGHSGTISETGLARSSGIQAKSTKGTGRMDFKTGLDTFPISRATRLSSSGNRNLLTVWKWNLVKPQLRSCQDKPKRNISCP